MAALQAKRSLDALHAFFVCHFKTLSLLLTFSSNCILKITKKRNTTKQEEGGMEQNAASFDGFSFGWPQYQPAGGTASPPVGGGNRFLFQAPPATTLSGLVVPPSPTTAPRMGTPTQPLQQPLQPQQQHSLSNSSPPALGSSKSDKKAKKERTKEAAHDDKKEKKEEEEAPRTPEEIEMENKIKGTTSLWLSLWSFNY